MNRLDKMIQKERKARYRRLKKIFKARDMAKSYLSEPFKVSDLDRYFCDFHPYSSLQIPLAHVAKNIIDQQLRISRMIQRNSRPVTAKK